MKRKAGGCLGGRAQRLPVMACVGERRKKNFVAHGVFEGKL